MEVIVRHYYMLFNNSPPKPTQYIWPPYYLASSFLFKNKLMVNLFFFKSNSSAPLNLGLEDLAIKVVITMAMVGEITEVVEVVADLEINGEEAVVEISEERERSGLAPVQGTDQLRNKGQYPHSL